MDSEQSAAQGISVDEQTLSFKKENVPSMEIPATKVPLPWKELLSETVSGIDDIEEGPLDDSGEIGNFPRSCEGPSNRPGWTKFVSDPGLSVTEGGMNGGNFSRSYFSDDVQTRKQRDWSQFLSTSYLVEGEKTSKMTPLSSKTDEDYEVGHNSLVDFTARQKITSDLGGKSDPDSVVYMPARQNITPNIGGRSPVTSIHNSSEVVTMPQVSHVIARTNSVPSSQSSGNLPARPLTIGDNSMTIASTLVYRPLSPFTPDGNLPRTASSTPVIPTLPSTSQDVLERDDPGDMSAQERLQPLGRDGLEVKQGPPWGITIPLFQPHSRKSSFSSNDSNSSYGSTSLLRTQTTSAQTRKPDADSTASAGFAEGPLSRRSSLRSLEPKEPMAAKSTNPPLDNLIGKFHALKPIESDVDSPVSRILGPTFKTTQKMLEELQRRPLGIFNDRVDEILKEDSSLSKKDEGFSDDEERNEGSLVADLVPINLHAEILPENKHTDLRNQTSNLFEKASQESKIDSVENSIQLTSTDIVLKVNPHFPDEHKADSSFIELSKNYEPERLMEDKRRHSQLLNKTEIPKTSDLVDNYVHISTNARPSSQMIDGITQSSKHAKIENIDIESLSWEDVLEVHSMSGELSEFDRVASESISYSNAIANRFRDELKSADLENIESDDEGMLDEEDTTRTAKDSGMSESTTNDEIFHPKGLVPLLNQNEVLGIYDVRKSTGPGSTERKRRALGKFTRKRTPPSQYSGIYVSEGTTGTDDRGLESTPEGKSTPKSNDSATLGSNENEMVDLRSDPPLLLKLVNTSKKADHDFTYLQPSASVKQTWSISKPVMSQLHDPRRTLLVKHAVPKQKPKQRTRDEQEIVHSSKKERKRISHHREHINKASKSIKQHSHSSESNEYTPHNASIEKKKSLADKILENFHREEIKQERKMKKLEELKQNQAAPDLNALWERFQVFVSKNFKEDRKLTHVPRSKSFQRNSPSSDISVASSSDIPFIEEKSCSETINLSTDSNEEFEKFLTRVREVKSSTNESLGSRRSSDSHPRRTHDNRLTPVVGGSRKPHPKVEVLSSTDQITTTSEKPSESEPTLSLPMWLGMNKHPKKKTKAISVESLKSGSAVCTCGGRIKKVTKKPSTCVRDVGVNCPTPPAISHEVNTVDVGALKFNTRIESESPSLAPPPSLVKLTLQDAFMYSQQDFIKRSRTRIQNIKERRKEANVDDVVVIPTEKTRSKKVTEEETKTGTTKPLKVYEELQQRKPRQMTQKEIREVNKRIYKNLPEVTKKNYEERREEFYKTNRLRAKLYGKHIRNSLNRMYSAV